MGTEGAGLFDLKEGGTARWRKVEVASSCRTLTFLVSSPHKSPKTSCGGVEKRCWGGDVKVRRVRMEPRRRQNKDSDAVSICHRLFA